MFLKSVELFGFKSFADRTRFEFADGVTALLGPNGSGKSNVVDSIKWVLGSQSLTAVRAGKREDVIFNGTDTRKPMPMCEVILTLDNQENILNIEASEVEIKRRMFRNGDNEYYINRERALLRNVRELFMDTGVGKAAYSILEQGKIDQILSLKPEDRRYIFEEAAGISRFKQESDAAAKKLEKTDANMAQAQILFSEEEKKYNSRKFQMERLVKSRELTQRQEKIEVELQLSYVQSLTKFQQMKQDELDKTREEYAELEKLLSSQREQMDAFDRDIAQVRERRDEINNRLNRADEQHNSLDREIEILTERFREIHERTKIAKFKAQQVMDKVDRDKKNLQEKQALLQNITDSLLQISLSIEKDSQQITQLQQTREEYGNKINALAQENAEISQTKANITQEISSLANEITTKLQQSIEGSGYSSAQRARSEKALLAEIQKARTIVCEKLDFMRGLGSLEANTQAYLKALDETDEVVRTELDEINGLFQEYSGNIPTFLDEFTSSTGTLAHKAELDSKLQACYTREEAIKSNTEELQVEIERMGRQLILKESDLQELKVEEASLKAKGESVSQSVKEMEQALAQSQLEFSDAQTDIDSETLKETQAVDQIDQAKARQADLKKQMEQLKDDLTAVSLEIDTKTAQFNDKSSQFSSQFQKKQELSTKIATEQVNIQNLQESIQKIYTDFFDNTGKSLREFNDHEITANVDDLKKEAEEVREKIRSLGYINYMAEEEFNEAKKNYDFYKQNLDDLTKSKNDLEEVLAQIKQKSEEMFIETYNTISTSFEEMFSILFGGGHASLSLTEPEDVLHSGIEITAQPPGKKPSTLTLLSGGEKSMTAVALLFATYKVKPSPFCILDEIDAALDARNIGSFMKVLETFGDKSQFIIITHNKGTVMGASSLLGVTQEELGVSKMIGIKIDDSENVSDAERTLKS